MGVQWHKRPTQLGGRTQWGFVTSCVSTPTISRRKQSRPRSASRLGDSFSTILVGVALACERALRHAYANLARLAHPKSQAGSASPVLRLRVKEAPGVDSRRLANGALSNLSQFRGCRGGQVQRPRVAPKGCHVLLRQQPPGRNDRRRVHLTLEETAERVLCLDHLSQMRRGVFEGKFILAEAVPFWGRERWQICSHAADLYVLAGFRESSGVEVLHPEPSPASKGGQGVGGDEGSRDRPHGARPRSRPQLCRRLGVHVARKRRRSQRPSAAGPAPPRPSAAEAIFSRTKHGPPLAAPPRDLP